MLKFYYNSRSPMARRVWRGLLEKDIAFEPILNNLIHYNIDHAMQWLQQIIISIPIGNCNQRMFVQLI